MTVIRLNFFLKYSAWQTCHILGKKTGGNKISLIIRVIIQSAVIGLLDPKGDILAWTVKILS